MWFYVFWVFRTVCFKFRPRNKNNFLDFFPFQTYHKTTCELNGFRSVTLVFFTTLVSKSYGMLEKNSMESLVWFEWLGWKKWSNLTSLSDQPRHAEGDEWERKTKPTAGGRRYDDSGGWGDWIRRRRSRVQRAVHRHAVVPSPFCEPRVNREVTWAIWISLAIPQLHYMNCLKKNFH